MLLNKYPKVPTTAEQIKITLIIISICLIGFAVLNRDLGFSAEWKRFLTRSGGYIILAGSVLGSFNFLWNKKNKVKLTLAQRDFSAHTRAIHELNGKDQQGASLLPSIQTLEAELQAAKKAIDEAENFEDTVAKVGITALFLFTLGTILQVLAA